MAEPLPLVRERSVQPSGQSTGFLNVNYSPEAFGAGIGRALQDTAKVINYAGQVEQQIGDTVKANQGLEVGTKIKDEIRTTLFDPNGGVLTKRGGNAIGASQTMDSFMADMKKRHVEGITDPKLRTVVERLWASEEDQAKNLVANHELREVGQYQGEVTQGVMLSAMQDAYNGYNNPSMIEKAIKDTRVAIAANTLGKAPELTKAAENEAISKIHTAVITRLAAESPREGAKYYEDNKDQVHGADHTAIRQLIEPALRMREVDEHVARVTQVGQAGTDLWSRLKFAESSNNPAAESPDGASGVAQVMPDTARYVARKLGYTDVSRMTDDQIKTLMKTNQPLNEELGRTYLNEQLQTFGGDIEAALVAYNSGPARAEAFLKHNGGKRPGERDYNVPGMPWLAKETEPYVRKILGRQDPATPRTAGPAPAEANAFLKTRLVGHSADHVDGMKPEFQSRLAGLISAAPPGIAEGLGIYSGKRSTERQRELWNASDKSGKWVARPGHSRHEHGDAADLSYRGKSLKHAPKEVVAWVHANAAQFGLKFPLGHENWHVEMQETRGGMNFAGGTPGGADQAPSTFTTPSGGVYGNTNAPALSAWLASAQEIEDPTVRELAESKFRVMAAGQKAAQEEQLNAAKQSAYDFVLGGGDPTKLPPELLRNLDPDFAFTTLPKVQEQLVGGGIKTDYERWTQIRLAAADPEDVTTINPIDHRDYLADTEYKQLVELVAAGRAAQKDKSKQAQYDNLRTPTKIIEDTLRAGGRDLKSSTDLTLQARIARRLDEQIAAYQASGKPVSPIEMQDIVDKLLIEDKLQPNMFQRLRRQGNVAEVENANTFVAAATEADIQPDDKAVLVDTFSQAFQRAPNEEEAVDTYNRAMRVWMGGDVELSEDETELLTANFVRITGRQPQGDEVSRWGREWLLKYLRGAR